MRPCVCVCLCVCVCWRINKSLGYFIGCANKEELPFISNKLAHAHVCAHTNKQQTNIHANTHKHTHSHAHTHAQKGHTYDQYTLRIHTTNEDSALSPPPNKLSANQLNTTVYVSTRHASSTENRSKFSNIVTDIPLIISHEVLL